VEDRKRLSSLDSLTDDPQELDAGGGIDTLVGSRSSGAELDGGPAELERVDPNEHPAPSGENGALMSGSRQTLRVLDDPYVAAVRTHHAEKALERRAVSERALQSAAGGGAVARTAREQQHFCSKQ
jgi:hypothetical protein